MKYKMMQCMEVVTWELSVQLAVTSAGGTITSRGFGRTVLLIFLRCGDNTCATEGQAVQPYSS